MNIELVEFAPEDAMHPHAEIVVITTTDQPLGPANWPEVWQALEREQREALGERCGTGEKSGTFSSTVPGSACKFDVDHEYETDPETKGFSQYWAFPTKR